MNLFKWIDELFTKKRPWDSFSEEEQKKFSPFMVNRYLSMNNDYLPIVNHFQKLTIEVMPHSAVYKFYCSLLPNKKTYLRYLSGKKTKVTDSRSADSESVRGNFVTMHAYMGRYTQDWVYRRRRCDHCSISFNTVELSFEDLQAGWDPKY